MLQLGLHSFCVFPIWTQTETQRPIRVFTWYSGKKEKDSERQVWERGWQMDRQRRRQRDRQSMWETRVVFVREKDIYETTLFVWEKDIYETSHVTKFNKYKWRTQKLLRFKLIIFDKMTNSSSIQHVINCLQNTREIKNQGVIKVILHLLSLSLHHHFVWLWMD